MGNPICQQKNNVTLIMQGSIFLSMQHFIAPFLDLTYPHCPPSYIRRTSRQVSSKAGAIKSYKERNITVPSNKCCNIPFWFFVRLLWNLLTHLPSSSTRVNPSRFGPDSRFPRLTNLIPFASSSRFLL